VLLHQFHVALEAIARFVLDHLWVHRTNLLTGLVAVLFRFAATGRANGGEPIEEYPMACFPFIGFGRRDTVNRLNLSMANSTVMGLYENA